MPATITKTRTTSATSPVNETITLRNPRNLKMDELWEAFKEAIDLVDGLEWAPRATPYCLKAIATLRDFAAGKADTKDVKYHFATLSLLGGTEVLMTDREAYAVYAVTEVCHAAAHLGHLSVAASRIGEANRHYEGLQKSYVVLGMSLAKRYFDLATL